MSTSASHRLVVEDRSDPDTFAAIFHALDASSTPLIGPTQPHFLVIPLRDAEGLVVGGFWGCTIFRWLHVQMLFVPATLRGRGIGAALMEAAETEARERGCLGAHVDAFSFQAAPFYRRIGYAPFGVLHDFPPGYERFFFCKRFATAGGGAAP